MDVNEAHTQRTIGIVMLVLFILVVIGIIIAYFFLCTGPLGCLGTFLKTKILDIVKNIWSLIPPRENGESDVKYAARIVAALGAKALPDNPKYQAFVASLKGVVKITQAVIDALCTFFCDIGVLTQLCNCEG